MRESKLSSRFQVGHKLDPDQLVDRPNDKDENETCLRTLRTEVKYKIS